MPYLPTTPLNQTTFPYGNTADLQVGVNLIAERYQRHYPLLPYYALKQKVTVSSGDVPVGENGTTKFDTLWGESVADTMVTGWEQPHLSDEHAASVDDVDIFEPVKYLNMRVQREAQALDLKRWGFDKVRDLLVFIPHSMLDSAGITVRVGDKIVWDGKDFNVLQQSGTGYWKNTNVTLYRVLNLENRRKGS